MDIGIHHVATLKLFGLEIWITESMVNVWLIGLVLIAIAIGIRIVLKKSTRHTIRRTKCY